MIEAFNILINGLGPQKVLVGVSVLAIGAAIYFLLWMAKPKNQRQMANKPAVWIASTLTVFFTGVYCFLIWVAYTGIEGSQIDEFTNGAGLSFLYKMVIADMLVITVLHAALLSVFVFNLLKFSP